jgi:hypothetical protein
MGISKATGISKGEASMPKNLSSTTNSPVPSMDRTPPKEISVKVTSVPAPMEYFEEGQHLMIQKFAQFESVQTKKGQPKK